MSTKVVTDGPDVIIRKTHTVFGALQQAVLDLREQTVGWVDKSGYD